MRIVSSALFSSLLLFTGVAHADLVRPPPDNCPPGLDGVTSHNGPGCRPQTCSETETCPPDSACREVAWCQRQETHEGRRGPHDVTVTQGFCADDGSCPPPDEGEPYTCVRNHRCEPTVETPAWDAAARQWTGRPYSPGASDDSSASDDVSPPADDPPATAPIPVEPEPDSSFGCAVGLVGGGRGGGGFGAVMLFSFVLACALRRRRE